MNTLTIYLYRKVDALEEMENLLLAYYIIS